MGLAAIAESADVQRRGQYTTDGEQRDADELGDLAVWHAHRRQLEHPSHGLDQLGVRLDELGIVAPEAEWREPARIGLLGPFARVALPDPPRQPPAIPLRVF